MKKKWLLIALALGAVYMMTKKSTATPTLASQVPSGGLPGTIAAAADDAIKLGSTIASELKGMDGMVPDSLHGHMASLGAYGELGSFHGGNY